MVGEHHGWHGIDLEAHKLQGQDSRIEADMAARDV
jgi:hypothetical protein